MVIRHGNIQMIIYLTYEVFVIKKNMQNMK